MYFLCYNKVEIENLKLSKFYVYYSLYITFHIKKGGNYMKYNKYLIISTLTLIILVTTLFYTKNIFYLYLTILICIYVSFIKFYQEKDKLLVKTNKILNLLKLESIIYTTAMLILYFTIMFSYIQKIQKVEYLYIAYSISAILLLLYAVINIKRTLLIRKELRNNNFK